MAVVAFLLIGGLVAVALGIALCLWQAIKRRQRMAELHAPLLDRCVRSLETRVCCSCACPHPDAMTISSGTNSRLQIALR